MNQDWKAFLNESNVSFIDISAVSQKEMLFDLSNKGLIKVSGEDAEPFLQNQLTNDIRNVTETTHQASAWCSPKGRIIANFQVFKRKNSYFLTVSADLLEHVIKKLRMYVMMSKVVLEDVTESTAHFGYKGELQKLIEVAPTDSGQTLQTDHLTIIRLIDSEPRYEVFADCSDNNSDCEVIKKLWEQSADSADTITNNGWEYLNILAGLPNISEASSEAWIPQMVNYIAIDGVDFKKGCYPGQEIVARLNYLGKTKRRMYRLQINTDQLPDIGDAIASDSDKVAGKILNVALNPDGIVEGLAIMKIAEVEKNLTLATDEKITISLLSLPYSVGDD